MANDPKQPIIGELSIDATDLTFLVDLEPGARVHLRPSQPGIAEAIAEIKANQMVSDGARVVPESTFQELLTVEARIKQIDAKLPAVKKLAEMMGETRALLDDKQQRLVSAVARMAEAHATAFGDNSMLARYEKTRTYRSAVALKAARTRRRNQEDELDIDEPIEPGPDEPSIEPVAEAAAAPVATPAIEAKPATPAAPPATNP